jgi:hypothetical protein
MPVCHKNAIKNRAAYALYPFFFRVQWANSLMFNRSDYYTGGAGAEELP